MQKSKYYKMIVLFEASVIQLAGAFLFGRCCFCTR
nr:MAG TPA: hypothetical protein [Caudoviricetes sp.]